MAPDFLLHLMYFTPGASWQAGAWSLGVLECAPEQLIGGLGPNAKSRAQECDSKPASLRAVPSCHV